jgi:thiamine-phosphate pyrophosphorylase
MDAARRAEVLREADLYVVTCEPLSEGRGDLEILAAALDAGVRLVQLRDKRASKRALFSKALAARRLVDRYDALLVLNDHLDVALATGADGVHLGQDDLPIAAARALAPDLVLGASSHSLEQALEAEAAGASYVNIGPIYPTATKENAPRFLGPEAITAIAPHLHVPYTCMGGIHGANLDQVLAAGARIVAVVTAVTKAPDPRAAAAELIARIRQGRVAAG